MPDLNASILAETMPTTYEEALLIQLASITKQLKALKAKKDSYTEEIMAAIAGGRCPRKVTAGGMVISERPGRYVTTYDEYGKNRRMELDAELFAGGHAKKEQGAPFLDIREAAKGAAS